jgi:peroxiredoxin
VCHSDILRKAMVEMVLFLWDAALLGYNFIMLINSLLPDFSLSETSGRIHRLVDYHDQLVVLNFWSAECPWSERADAHLLAVTKRLAGQVMVLPVASNLNETVEMINQAIHLRGIDFVLQDVGCKLADVYGAQTTPHAFVIDGAGVLRYQGAVDDVTFRKRNPERFYVEEALLALADDRLPAVQETNPYGCSIVRHI